MRRAPEHFDLAQLELEALFERCVKFGVRQRDDALGFGRRFGPDDRRAPAFERQDRERTGGEKVLFGAALMIALMRDIDDDGRLAIVPTVGGDAGAAANAGARAVGGDKKPGRERDAVCQRHIDVLRRCRPRF